MGGLRQDHARVRDGVHFHGPAVILCRGAIASRKRIGCHAGARAHRQCQGMVRRFAPATSTRAQWEDCAGDRASRARGMTWDGRPRDERDEALRPFRQAGLVDSRRGGFASRADGYATGTRIVGLRVGGPHAGENSHQRCLSITPSPGVLAMGGSTKAWCHPFAMARRAGCSLDLDSLRREARVAARGRSSQKHTSRRQSTSWRTLNEAACGRCWSASADGMRTDAHR